MITRNNGYVFAIAAATIWSGFILVSRMGGISTLNGYDVIAIRYATCALIVLPLWWYKWRFVLFTRKLWLCSAVGGLGYALCTFHGFQQVGAAQAAILLPGSMPLLILLCAVLLSGERPPLQKWLGIALITFGIGTLLWPLLQAGGQLTQGHWLLLGGALCWALFSVLVKRWEVSPWQATVSLAILTCIVYLPMYLAFAPKAVAATPWRDIALQAFYQGFMATIVQMIFYVRAVQQIGPSSMGAVMAIVPLISGIAAIYLFGEAATTALYSALILVSAGSLLVHLKLHRGDKPHALR